LNALDSKIKRLAGVEAVYYHNSWPYFDDYVGIEAVDFVEPYPGVPPSPSHVKELSEHMTERGIKVIGVEPYFDKRVPEKIASASGATVITLYPSIGGRDSDESYVDWFEGNIDALLRAVER
jgi:ABC-type Zn uptake system ZnuABC Zn-binding protein ZnuA